jgi:two-component system, NarL family, invasion response regulator UvrY
MNKGPISVLIVDDHALVRAGIRLLLQDAKGIKVVGEATTGEDGVRLARELLPQVVLMDIKMPGIGGIEATRKILHYHSQAKILIVTVCCDILHPSRLLQAGAAGYLTKDVTPAEMVQAIHAVYAGQRYISSGIAQKMVLKNAADLEKSPFEILSDRELQVVSMITKGIKTSEIAKKLSLSSKTINTYRYRIFKKLNLNNNDVELTHLALQCDLTDGS